MIKDISDIRGFKEECNIMKKEKVIQVIKEELITVLKEYGEDEFDRSPEMYSGGRSSAEESTPMESDVSQILVVDNVENLQREVAAYIKKYGEAWLAANSADAVSDVVFHLNAMIKDLEKLLRSGPGTYS